MKTHKDHGHHTDASNDHKNNEHGLENGKSRYFGNHENSNSKESCNSNCQEKCTCTCQDCDCKADCPENCCG